MKLRIYSVLILFICFAVDTESYGQQQSKLPGDSINRTSNGNSKHSEATAIQNDTIITVENWVRKNTIPLKTVDAGNGFDDLQPLKKLIGSSHLVALGEATHGSGEFFRLKHRLLEFLVNEMGFTVFAIEASMPESQIINDYVLNGKGDPEKVLACLYNWVWNTEEVLDMIKWMRSYNSDPSHINKLKFYGFDMQSPSMATKITLHNISKIDSVKAEELGKNLSMLSNPFTAPDFAVAPKEKKEKAYEAIRHVLKFYELHKHDYLSFGSESEWDIMRQMAVIVSQHIESKMNASGFINLDPTVRDKSMADNIRWIHEHEGSECKMVIWAHNLHVATHTTMGRELRRIFGDDMFVFGFAFDHGSFQAAEYPVGYIQNLLFPSEKGVHPFTVSPLQTGKKISLDRMLTHNGLKYAVIDLRALPENNIVKKWFGEGQLTRNIGSVFVNSDDFGVLKLAVSEIYNALIFIDSISPSHLTESGRRPPAPVLSAPANTDFENSEQGETPVNWLVPKQSAAFGFSVNASRNNPNSGKLCAVITRKPETSYGEMYGSLSQLIDATPYRGKNIILKAAVRTDVSEAGSQAYMWLRIAKKFFGPAALLFYDNMAEHPITDNKWRSYEITSNVPADADVIGFGLALVGDGQAWIDSVSIKTTDN